MKKRFKTIRLYTKSSRQPSHAAQDNADVQRTMVHPIPYHPSPSKRLQNEFHSYIIVISNKVEPNRMGEHQGDDGLFKVVSCVPVKVRSAMGDARFEEIRSEVRHASNQLRCSQRLLQYIIYFFLVVRMATVLLGIVWVWSGLKWLDVTNAMTLGKRWTSFLTVLHQTHWTAFPDTASWLGGSLTIFETGSLER